MHIHLWKSIAECNAFNLVQIESLSNGDGGGGGIYFQNYPVDSGSFPITKHQLNE